MGKSSIVLRYTKRQFTEDHELTIGAAFTSMDVPVSGEGVASGTTAKLHIWDTAGEEMYRAITQSFYRDAHAAFIVYAVDDPSSLEHARSWMQDFHRACPGAIVALVGNKCDLPSRATPTEAGKQMAQQLGSECRAEVPFFEVSAKADAGISAAFEGVASRIYSTRT